MTPAGFLEEVVDNGDYYSPSVTAFSEPLAFARQSVIDESQLEEMRGGFSIAGLDINFGATLKTQIDNIHYETILSISQTGTRVISETLRDMGLASNQQLTQVGRNGQPLTDTLPANISLPGMKEFSGVTLNDPKGFSAALHSVTRDAIMSSVVSHASNRDIRQNVNLDIQLNNVKSIREAQQRSVIMNSLF
ncbi:hypothetical protein GCM10008094_21240 [Aidingimonas halophila]|nr:hypothetical protein GCM10008094_21240 [Aidingimonas halophila]